MRVLSGYSPTHAKLCADYFVPSLLTMVGFGDMPTSVDVERFEQSCQSGVFRADGWGQQMRQKTELWDRANKLGKPWMWIDADCIVAGPLSRLSNYATKRDSVALFQNDNIERCSGVVYVHQPALFQPVIDGMLEIMRSPNAVCDQKALNQSLHLAERLHDMPNWVWSVGLHTNRECVNEQDIDDAMRYMPKEVVIFHANWMRGLPLKRYALEQADLACFGGVLTHAAKMREEAATTNKGDL